MSGYKGLIVPPTFGGVWQLRAINAARNADTWPFVPPPAIKTPLMAAIEGGANAHWGMQEVEGRLAAYAMEVLADSPVAYWRIGSLLEDELGVHDGAHITGVSEVEGPLGEGSVAAHYEAGRSEVPYHADLNQAGSNNLTVEFWLNLDSLTTNVGVLGITDGGSWSSSGWGFYARSTADAQLSWVINGSSSYRYGNLNVGQWHHIVCLLDEGFGSVYLDGVLVQAPVSLGTIGSAGSSPLVLGTLGGLADLDGRLAEVAIYDHVLSEARIQRHLNAGGMLLESINAYDLLASGGDLVAGPPLVFASLSSLDDGRAEREHFDARVDDLTLEVWLRTHAGDGVTRFLHNGDPDATGYGLQLNNDGRVELVFGGVVGGQLNNAPSPSRDVPHHLVVVRDAGSWSLYLDNQLLGTGSGTPTAPAPGDPFALVADERIDLDATSFYPRALSAAEVAANYDVGLGLWRPPPRGTVGEEEFEYTGGMQSYVVPNGATKVRIECFGAQGGGAQGGVGGKGGRVRGVFPVAPGETLNVFVGGKGIADTPSSLSGGWNGGGSANAESSSAYGASGGGASDVRKGGTALADRVIVAGGGGGTGYYSGAHPAGGLGGGLEGGDGANSGSYFGGGGGTQDAGGVVGGTNSSYDQDGSLGEGGNQTGSSGGWNACAGGGGYYGGASGGALGAGGGGGSGYVGDATETQLEDGVREGHGYVVITALE